MKPHRIQRSRKKGWRMPPNTIYCGRGSEWGNPFLVDGPSGFTRAGAVLMFNYYAKWRLKHEPDWLVPIRGFDLCDFCSLDELCHVDTLLELANR